MRGGEFTTDFMRILATRAPGSPVSMNTVRHDLTANSIPPICGGALLRWARDRGYLEWTGTEPTDAGNVAARGRPIQTYRRTTMPLPESVCQEVST